MRYIKKGGLKIKPTDILFYYVVIDILIGPYIKWISCLGSMILVYGWFVLNFRTLQKKRTVWMGCGIIVTTIISIGMSYFIQGPLWFRNNITNGILICTYVVYYIFFEYHLAKKLYAVSKIFEVYIWITFIFAGLYLVNPQLFFNVRSFWTLNGTKIVFEDPFYNRFTFIQSDPNSIGCVLCSMILYILLFDKKISASRKIVLTVIVGCVSAITLSTTSILVYMICIGGYVLLNNKVCYKINIRKMLVLFLVAFLGIAGIVSVNIKFDLMELIISRVGANLKGGNLSGRTIIWGEIIRDFEWEKYILWGYGGSLIDGNGISRTPHNGHFYIILAYGMSAYLIFIFMFFSKKRRTRWKEYLVILPLFLLFSVNTLLIDFRACLVLPLIASLYKSEARC